MSHTKIKMPLTKNIHIELEKTRNELEKYKLEMNIYHSYKAEGDTILPGCVVQLLNSERWGRVLTQSYKGKCQVEFNDHLGSYRTVDLHNLTNLSIGYGGYLDRKIWLLEQNYKVYTKIYDVANVPPILLEDNFTIIEITEVNYILNFYMEMTFTIAKNLRSGVCVLPLPVNNKLLDLGYYEVETNNGDIINIIKTSRIAFEKLIGDFRSNNL